MKVFFPNVCPGDEINNLMARFQKWLGFGECRVPIRCHRSQAHNFPGLIAPDRVRSIGQIILKCVLMQY